MTADRRVVTSRERLVHHVQELERLQQLREDAAADLKHGFQRAEMDGYDAQTLKVVLKLRTLTPEQRRERRALEAIYLAALGMLEGDPLPDEARRRLDDESRDAASKEPPADALDRIAPPETSPPPQPQQPPLILKDPAEARQEGADAAGAGKRIYDNPYPAGDPCRAAWDEGWCTQRHSHGLDTPEAYQRRTTKPPDRDPKPDGAHPGKGEDAGGDAKKGAA